MKKEKLEKDIKILFLLLILTLLQAGALDYIKIFNVSANLSLAVVVVYALLSRSRVTLIFSFWAGFLNDIFSPQGFGLNILVFVIIGYIVLRLSRKFLIESLPLQLGIISSALVVQAVMVQFMLSLYTGGLPAVIFLRSVFLSVAYTALLSPLAIKAIRYL